MTRPIRAVIHTAALASNYAHVKACAPNSKVFAVVKANAYGHGIANMAAALPGADAFATLEMPSALTLRELGVKQAILLLEGVFSAAELQLCAKHDFWLSVHDERGIGWLENTDLSRPVHIFLKLNTGMNRLGFPAEKAPALVERLQHCSNVASITLMAHFATADDPEQGVAAQCARFDAACSGLALPVSLANSAALLAYPETQRQWVRPGIVLYGSSPFSEKSAAELGLQAAMTLSAEVIAVQDLKEGDTVGYGAGFVAARPMRIGIVACGYADGYPRHAPTGTPALVDGARSRLIGRVSMDMLAVDLSELPSSGVGSSVELWGKNLPVDDVAAAAGTIGYELMCAVAARVPVFVEF
ncbi:alanine racemase [Iodobacter fluviatilis]|uniref:Alanine racemase n=1 Tax=Iodobacter fluviatilis TaxID=537 RepID=A0A377Q6B6_9NEIS|nr:alanine racemase [Iodobacter fluviatilis]TCU90344.1 alanine racemase [Iodobacter fluviatilis]STQ89371.1 Alanine racemase, catabolic [Iodobacter fluviatilis]